MEYGVEFCNQFHDRIDSVSQDLLEAMKEYVRDFSFYDCEDS